MTESITWEESLEIAESLSSDEVYEILDEYYEDNWLIQELKAAPWNVRPAFIAHKIYGDQFVNNGLDWRILSQRRLK